MIHDRRFYRNSLCALKIIIILGLAFCFAWPTSSAILAAQNEIAGQNHTPGVARHYVAKAGDGSDGKSWLKAFTNVPAALIAAKNGDEIWVAAGVYIPGSNREDSFNLVPGVKLYGGFKTGDARFSDRDWKNNLTVLSGDIGGDDTTDGNGVVIDPADINGNNSYHVVFADSASGTAFTNSTVLDGFTITAGQANGLSDPDYHGGGFFCDGSYSGDCSPSLNNLTFSGNMADRNGGAMYNSGHSKGKSSPSLREVDFSNNLATIGGGIFNDGSPSGTSSPSLKMVTFASNTALFNGGAMFNSGGTNGSSSPELMTVTFTGNTAINEGGAMFNSGGTNGTSSPILKGVTFTGNSASYGGAVYNYAYKGDSSPDMRNVMFSENSAEYGGAMYNFGNQGDSNPILINVIFSGNSVTEWGGAMVNDGSDTGYSSPSLFNVVFSGNRANYGGAMYNLVSNGTSSPILTNVTFSGNSAEFFGGAMYNNGLASGLASPLVRNCVLWNNRDITGNGKISAAIYNASTTTKLIHCIVQGSFPGGNWVGGSYVNGGGNVDQNPMFVTPVDVYSTPNTGGDLRLKNGSPAIDAGDNTLARESFDLDNLWRIRDGDKDGVLVVDMGAYEFPHNVPYELFSPLVYR